MEYRLRESGELKSQSEIKKLNANMSLPRVWTENVCDALGVDPILATPTPAPTGDYKTVVRNGAEQDASGNWVQAWIERDMFAEYTDEDGIVHTKADQEAEYQTRKDAQLAESLRSQRNQLLAETDFYALSDVTMSDAIATYRQALRDLPAQDGWPNVEFPERPSE